MGNKSENKSIARPGVAICDKPSIATPTSVLFADARSYNQLSLAMQHTFLMRLVVNMRTSVSGLNDNEAARYPIAFSLNVGEDITSTT
jgi:hypothetical protein